MDWTDDRLQERFDSIDRRFGEINRRLDRRSPPAAPRRRRRPPGRFQPPPPDTSEECFVAAFDRAVEWGGGEIATAAVGDPAAGGLSWSEGIATGLRAVTKLVAAEPERARLVLVEAQTGGPELSVHFEAMLDRVAAKLREGRALDTAPADLPTTHEEATAGALAWLLRERLERGGEGEELEALYPGMIDIALAPYLEGEPRATASDG